METRKSILISGVDGFSFRIRELTNNLHALHGAQDGQSEFEATIGLLSPLSITPLIASIKSSEIPITYSSNSLKIPAPIEFKDAEISFEPGSSSLTVIHQDLRHEVRTSRPLTQLHNSFLHFLKRKVIADNNFLSLIGVQTIGFILSEILDNVEQHAKAQNIYLSAKYFNSNNSVELCLVDDGVGIYQSLRAAGRNVADEKDAMNKVIQDRLSSKNELGKVKRGLGISTTRTIVTSEELLGDFFILSGSTGYLESLETSKMMITSPSPFYRGTIVMIRIRKPVTAFNLYNYVK